MEKAIRQFCAATQLGSLGQSSSQMLKHTAVLRRVHVSTVEAQEPTRASVPSLATEATVHLTVSMGVIPHYVHYLVNDSILYHTASRYLSSQTRWVWRSDHLTLLVFLTQVRPVLLMTASSTVWTTTSCLWRTSWSWSGAEDC